MSVSIFKNEWNKIDFFHLGPMSSVTYKHLNIFTVLIYFNLLPYVQTRPIFHFFPMLPISTM